MNALETFTFIEIFLFTLGLGLIGVGSLALLCFTLACPPGDDPHAR